MKSRQEIERLSRQKKKNRLLLILLCAMVVFVTAAIVLINVLPDESTNAPRPEPPEIFEELGESLYNNYPIAYPTIQESQIQTIRVTNKASYKNDYNSEEEAPATFYVLDRNEDIANGRFVLSYQDKDGKIRVHYPDIAEEDASFDYESLYSIEQGDGYGRIYKLTYLCVAIELPYFTERIALVEEGAARDSQLRGFGLDDPQSILEFSYKEKQTGPDGKETEVIKSRKVVIGDKNVTGVGYYFMVDDRPYIYSSMADYYNYAMLGFYSYVNSILVSEGLAEDSSYEPYLTTDYKQWLNETFKEPGTVIPENSSVIVYTDLFTPLEPKADVPDSEKDPDVLYDSKAPADGYMKEENEKLEINLSKKEDYERLVNALVGQKLGDFEKPITVTLTSDSKTLNLGELTSLSYQYEITDIEAILTSGMDITEDGTPVGQNNLVRVAYYLTVGGKRVSSIPYHGVIDLSNTAFDSSTVSEIRAASVGKLASAITLTVNYSAENSAKMEIKCVIDEVISIQNPKGAEISKVATDSTVYYRYYLSINGEKQGYSTGYTDFLKDESENAKNLKKQLLGKGTEKNLSITFYQYTALCEFVKDYMTYEIKKAEYFVTSELISSFKFQNRSKRDPFYGESIYENTLENKYGLYAINSSTCEAVAKMLGGIGDTTGTSEGLVGTETVAVGITPQIKEYYGLYAHTVYFELPRGIIVRDSGEDDVVDDYSHYSTLGFTLYISEEVFDTETKSYIRYVGSDLYDVVAKVNAEKLVFLKHSFVDFWARRSLMMFDVNYLQQMKVEFMMEDLKGSYNFNIPDQSKQNSSFVVRVTQQHNHQSGEPCDCTATNMTAFLDKLLKEDNTKVASLTAFYNYCLKDEEGVFKNSKGDVLFDNISTETAGIGYFRELMGLMYAVTYEGVLTEEEQNVDFESVAPLMRISIQLDADMSETTSPYWHVYEFYRCADRRIMVRLYEADFKKNSDGTEEIVMKSSGAVTDFYVSLPAFKKIVGAYFALLNGEKFSPENPYPEVSK